MIPLLRTVARMDARAEFTGTYLQRVRNRGIISCGRNDEVFIRINY